MSSIGYVIHEIIICNNTHLPMSMSFHFKNKVMREIEATQHKINLSDLNVMQILYVVIIAYSID